MNLWVRELATVNFLVIWLIIVGAFAFLKFVKNRLEGQIGDQSGPQSHAADPIREAEYEMNQNQAFGIKAGKEVGRIEINVERVMIWALVFTNLFSISYFFARLFKWI